MTRLFLNFLNMSIAAGWIVLAVLLLRPFMRKFPKWIHCLLWGIAGLRLVLPVFPVSVISLLPSSHTVPLDLGVTANPSVQTGMPTVNTAVNTMLAQRTAEDLLASILQIAWIVWIVGVTAILLYACISTLRLHIQVRISLQKEAHVYICDQVNSPFILGIFRPRIYLPSGLDATQTEHVLAHERAHLQRLDHLWKPIGFLLLAIYWFHPLLWVGYFLLCRDIEQACDEKVISHKDTNWRKHYSETLAACSAHCRLVMFCPVAFGEISVKSRIKGILSYKKPALWIIVIAVVGCSALALGFWTDPLPCQHSYESTLIQAPSCSREGIMTYTCTQCQSWYQASVPTQSHHYDAGQLLLAPTCSQTGIRVYACVSCSNTYEESVPMVSHTLGEAFLSQEPTCITAGMRSAGCTACNATFIVEQIPASNVHDLHEVITSASSCYAPGTGELQCAGCSYSEALIYPKLIHDFVPEETTWASCSSEGQQVFRCRHCNDTYTVTHPPKGHVWVTIFNGNRHCLECGRRTETSDSFEWMGAFATHSSDIIIAP